MYRVSAQGFDERMINVHYYACVGGGVGALNSLQEWKHPTVFFLVS